MSACGNSSRYGPTNSSKLPLPKSNITLLPKSALRESHQQLPGDIAAASMAVNSLDGAVDGAAVSIEAGCAVNYPASSRMSLSSTRAPAKLQRRRSQPQRAAAAPATRKTGFWIGYHYEKARKGKELGSRSSASVLGSVQGDAEIKAKDGGNKKQRASSSSSLSVEPFPPFQPVPEDSRPNDADHSPGRPATSRALYEDTGRHGSNLSTRESLLQPVAEEPAGYESDTTGHRVSLTVHPDHDDFEGYNSDSAVRPQTDPYSQGEPYGYDSDSTIRQKQYRRKSSDFDQDRSSPNRQSNGKHIEFVRDLPHPQHVCPRPPKDQRKNQDCCWVESVPRAPQRPAPPIPNDTNPDNSVTTTNSYSSLYTAPPPHPDCMCKDIEGDIHKDVRATDVARDIYDYPHRDSKTRNRLPRSGNRPRATTDAAASAPYYQSWVSNISIPATRGSPRRAPGPKQGYSTPPEDPDSQGDGSIAGSRDPSPPPPPTPASKQLSRVTTREQESSGANIREELLQPASDSGLDASPLPPTPAKYPVQKRIRKDRYVDLILTPTPSTPPQLPSIAPFTPLNPDLSAHDLIFRDRSQSEPLSKTRIAEQSTGVDNTSSPRIPSYRHKELRPAPLRVSPRRSGATDTREVGTQTSQKSLRMSESFVRQQVNAELSALPAATYPWLSLSLVKQVRQTFRTEFAMFQKQVDERLAAIEDRVKEQQEWLGGIMVEGDREERKERKEEMPGGWKDGSLERN